ncbi:MAG: DUF1501 domain-containing protein [Planctomycetia bacterium]|nr:DUF1501 domain-containing protein [Planctomycetia bacterium]
MLRILGSARTLCDRLTRREMLQAGGLSMLSLGLADLLRLKAAQGGESTKTSGTNSDSNGAPTAKAKRIILLYLYGAAAQHETYDPKPDAPAEIRGKFNPIATAVPGVAICEHLPKLAKIADRVTFIRSMSHPYNIHSAAYTMSGVERVDIPMELNPYDTRHWPCFGSVLDYLAQRERPEHVPEVPRNIALPFPFSSRCGEFIRGGPYGGFLGQAYNPVWTEFEGQATRVLKHWRGDVDQNVSDPYAGITPESRFTIAQLGQMQPGMTLDRLDRRRGLLSQLDDERRRLDKTQATASVDRFAEMAYSLITSTKLRDALDISKEPMERREQYGMTLFGQATLAGRRLLEAGATLVTVIWDEFGTANSAWDTHFNHYERLQTELLPGLDSALTSLLLDLEERGMLDDTLVMCLTEHGRTPQIFPKERGVGREHWSDVYCNLLAGGGIARGRVVGKSDKHGAYVAENPISPKDVLCTMYQLLGIDPQQTIRDKLNRPLPLVAEGRVVEELLA